MTKRLKRGPTRLQGEGDVINFIMQRDETPLAVSGVDTGRLATVCIPGGTGTNCTFDKIYKEEFLEMKNLKKVLALVLAMSTVFGLSVSAGAAATDFNDYDEIGNKEAVEVMNALNVIGGNDKGEFNPDGYLTRAEMCKMVSYVMNGGKAPVLSTSATPTYTDIKGHWGEAYIEYATSMGIVGGVGGGKFAPDSTLTGTQAAKMMLTAMGYDATVFGFGGTGWDTNVNRYANEAGLYDELGSLQPNLPITRDDAAQLMYNAMQATMMKRSWTLNPATGEQTETYAPWLDTQVNGNTSVTYPHTLLADKYNGAIEIGYMDGFSYDSVKNTWTYSFESNASFGGKAISAQNAVKTTSQKSDVDYTGLFGQQVKVIYNTKDENVTYGIYPNSSSVVVEGATGNVEDFNNTADTVTVAGKDYKLGDKAANIPVYNTNSDTAINTKLNALEDDESAYTFKLVDNTGDGKIDIAIKTPVTVAKINYVGKDAVQLSNKLGTVKLDDLTTYDGFAAGDWVYFISSRYSATGENTLVKAELKTGTIDGVRGGTDAASYEEYRIGDVWLNRSNVEPYQSEIVKAEVGDTVEYVTLGSTIFYSKITDAAANAKNIAMVINAGTKIGDWSSKNEVQAKLLFADGTTKTATISKIDGTSVTAETQLNSVIGKLVTYRADGSKYELKEVKDGNTAGYKAFVDATGTNEYQGGKIGKSELADDAIVFFGTSQTPGKDNKGDVFTGKEIKNTWSTREIDVQNAYVLTQEVNGFTYAKVVCMIDTKLPEITAGSNYGYLSAPTYRKTEDGKDYLYFTIHTANGELTAKAESTAAPSEYKQGTVITYDVVSDGVIKNVSVPNVVTGAVTGWDGSSKIALDGTPTEIDAKNTTVLYVDSDRMIGSEGSIQKAYEDTNGNLVDNVRYILPETHSDYVVLLVVDVNNEMKENPAQGSSITVENETDLQKALKYDNVTVTVSENISVSGSLELNGNTISVAEGKTLTVRNLYLQGGDVTGKGSVVVTGTTYMGSTLSVANFTTNKAEIVNGATMVITGGKVTIKTNLTGNGKLLIEGTAAVNVVGNLAVNVTANGSATLSYGSKDASVKIDGSNAAGGVYQYDTNKDTKVRAFNVVK